MGKQVTVTVVWPTENKKAILDTLQGLLDAIEKASALADALAQNMKQMKLEIDFGRVQREVESFPRRRGKRQGRA